ncbi:MAG: hypothetical protein U0414_43535 [Polyangiaceae bacterium]
MIDLASSTTVSLTGNYGTGVRDVGLLPDGKTILLRFRQAAAQIGTQLFARETYCLSLDGLVCASGQIEYQASVSFASVETNDCARWDTTAISPEEADWSFPPAALSSGSAALRGSWQNSRDSAA